MTLRTLKRGEGKGQTKKKLTLLFKKKRKGGA